MYSVYVQYSPITMFADRVLHRRGLIADEPVTVDQVIPRTANQQVATVAPDDNIITA